MDPENAIARRRLFRAAGRIGLAALATVVARRPSPALPLADAPQIEIDAPRIARRDAPIAIAIRIAPTGPGSPIAAIEVIAEGRPFGGIGRVVPPAGGAAIALDWHIRLDRSETLAVVARTADGASHRAYHNIVVG